MAHKATAINDSVPFASWDVDPPSGSYGGYTPNKFATTIGELEAELLLLAPGDVLGVPAGVYTGTPTGLRYDPSLKSANSGTEALPITIVAENMASLVTSGYSELRSGGVSDTAGSPAFGTLSQDHVHWVGFYSNESAADNKGIADSGTASLWTGTGCRLRYCKLLGQPVSFTDNHAGLRLENIISALVSDNYIEGYNENGSGSGVNQAGVQTYQVSNSVLEYNELVNNGDNFHFKGRDHTSNEIRFNISRTATIANFRIGGFVVNAAERNLVYQNLCIGSASDVEIASSATVPAAVSGTDVYNNTFYHASPGASTFGMYITDGQEVHDNTFTDNIIYRVGAKAGYATESSSFTTAQQFTDYIFTDYNNVFGPTSFADGTSGSNFNNASLATWQSISTGDDNTIISDPLFTNAGAEDFTLQGGSLAAGAGTGGIDMGCYPSGFAVDIGIRTI